MTLTRRRLLAASAAAPLAGCGFQPVYMPSAGGEPGVAQRELAAIHVALIPDRPGQLLRQALQQRFEGAGSDTKPLYDLTVNYWIAGEGLGIQPDTATTYIRLSGNANWVLTGRDPAATHITDGFSTARNAVNIMDNQYFGADLQTDQAYRILAQQIADQITVRLAIFFRRQAKRQATS